MISDKIEGSYIITLRFDSGVERRECGGQTDWSSFQQNPLSSIKEKTERIALTKHFQPVF